MEISISPEFEKFIQDEVKSGHYATARDVVEDALMMFRSLPEWTDESLRREILKGMAEIERGEYIQLNGPEELHAFFEDIKRRGRERLARKSTGQ